MTTVPAPALESTVDHRVEQTCALLRGLFIQGASYRFPWNRTGSLAYLLVLRVAAEQHFVGPGHLTHRFDLADEIGIKETEIGPVRDAAVASGLLRYEPGTYDKVGSYWVVHPDNAPPPQFQRSGSAPDAEFYRELALELVRQFRYAAGSLKEARVALDTYRPLSDFDPDQAVKTLARAQKIAQAGVAAVNEAAPLDDRLLLDMALSLCKRLGGNEVEVKQQIAESLAS